MYEGIIQQEQNRKQQQMGADADYKQQKLGVLAGLVGARPPKEKDWNNSATQQAAMNRKRIMGY